METRATTIKCVDLGYDALLDMFQYENNTDGLCDVCRGLIFKRYKSFRGGIELKVLKMKPIATGHLA